MTEFLFLFRGGDAKTLQESPETWQNYMQRWADWMGDLVKQGKFSGAQPLSPAGRVVKGSKKVVSDGPYMEGKEMIGGYMLCKAENYDEAIAISKGCPILEFDDGVVEVREVHEMQM
jgi:hypothetical protein